jgi:hypothetical protein
MRIGDIAPHISHDLVEEMKRLSMSFKSFPFHIHFKTYGDSHRDKFTLYWTTKKDHFGTPDQGDVVSEFYCQVVGLHEGRVLLRAHALPRKKYLGQVVPERFSDHDWNKQDWRHDYFLVEAKAEALWTIMEAHADFERAVKEVHES